MKKTIWLFILFLFSGSLCGIVAGDGQVTILHTNDMHAQFVPLPATWMDAEPLPMIGGMVALEHAVRRTRAEYPHSLLLDAGDMCTGTLLSKIAYKGALNGGFVEMMNLLHYDAFTIGNHEFDDGQENLARLIRLAQFDVISANLLAGQKTLAPHAYKIYKVGPVRVGVIGLILTDLDRVTAKQNLNNITVMDPAATAQALIDEIDPKTDLIVLLTHQGDDNDMALAVKLSNADVIIGGHSHTRIEKARIENDIVIAQAGSKTRYLGRLTVDVAGDSIANFDSELIAAWVDSVKSPNSKMSALVDKFDGQLKTEYGRQIGTLKTAWDKSNDYETNLGNFLTDVMRHFTNTDFALLNSGGIRKSLSAGPITKMDIMEILPFTNYVATFSCSGRELRNILQRDTEASINNSYGLFQISGIDYSYSVRHDSSVKIVDMKMNGEPIDPEKIYTGTSVDFVIHNLLDDYQLNNIKVTSKLISDVVIDYIEKNTLFESHVEGRIRRVK